MKKTMAWIMAAAMCLTATACGSTVSSTVSTAGSTAAGTVESSSVEGAFNLGLICPLSGSSAVSGQIMQNATKMAVDEINAAGGINGTIPINLVSVDDEGVPATSVTAMQKLVEQDKVNAVIARRLLPAPWPTWRSPRPPRFPRHPGFLQRRCHPERQRLHLPADRHR